MPLNKETERNQTLRLSRRAKFKSWTKLFSFLQTIVAYTGFLRFAITICLEEWKFFIWTRFTPFKKLLHPPNGWKCWVNRYIQLCIYSRPIYRPIGLAVRVLVNGPGDWGLIPGRVLPKSQKWYSLLNTKHYTVWMKGKVEQSRQRCSPLPYTSM